MGKIRVQRAYDYCHRCGGTFPWDQDVGLTPKRLTPGAERAAGARLGEHLDQRKALGGPTPWQWHKDAEGKACAYVSVDATSVRQQAKGGGAAEGRMPYVGMSYNPAPELPKDSRHAPPAKAQMQARYGAGLYSLNDLSKVMRRQGAQVGMDREDRWIGLTDGGNGLEPFVQKSFPRVEVVILDFWHVSDHLSDLARALHPQEEEKAKEQKGVWCHAPKHEGGVARIGILATMPLSDRWPALRAKHAGVLGYLRNHVSRMDYPTYLAKGWLAG